MSISKKCLLAAQIIEENFGKITADVARYMMRHENHSVTDIVRNFSRQNNNLNKELILKASQVREALLILLQHNCLIIEPDPTAIIDNENSSTVSVYLYKINLDMAINRLRFPKFISIVEDLYDTTAVKIIEELIFHGRLRYEQVIDDVLARQNEIRKVLLNQICVVNNVTDMSMVVDDQNNIIDPDIESQLPKMCNTQEIEEMFAKLTASRFIIPAPPRSSYVASEETIRNDIIKKEKAAKKSLLIGDVGGSHGTSSSSSSQAVAGSSSGTVNVKRARSGAGEVPHGNNALQLPPELQAILGHNFVNESVKEEAEFDMPPVKVARVSARGGRGGKWGRGRGGGRGVSEPKGGNNQVDELVSKPDHEVSSSSGVDLASNAPRKDVLWMIGWKQLAEEERNALCVSVTKQRMGAVAGEIVTLMLSAGSSDVSAGSIMTIEQILRGLVAVNKANRMKGKESNSTVEALDIHTLTKLLETMRCDSMGAVDKVMLEDKQHGGRCPHYTVNRSGILESVRRRLIHAIAEERFGYQSARIVELLQCKNYLEQQKIADMTILPAKEGRERLYELYQNKWVEYVEVSKRGDFNASNTYFFWTLNTEKLVEFLLNAQYGAVHNLRCRYLKESMDGKTLLDFSHKITDAEEASKFELLSQSLDRLDNAVLKVIENITVLGIL